ncbi:hypothetical protein Lal_00003575 [Lupinus albus]|nr:hypothetical protein Lal_00003575 [Lupinus albus]
MEHINQQQPPFQLPPPPPQQRIPIQWFGKRAQELTDVIELPTTTIPIIINVTTPTITFRITVMSDSVTFTITRSNFNTSDGNGLILYPFYDEPGRIAHGITLPTYLSYPAIITITTAIFTLYLVVNLDEPIFCTQDNPSIPNMLPPHVVDPDRVAIENITIPLCMCINFTRCDHVKTCSVSIYFTINPNSIAISANYQLRTIPWVAFMSSTVL